MKIGVNDGTTVNDLEKKKNQKFYVGGFLGLCLQTLATESRFCDKTIKGRYIDFWGVVTSPYSMFINLCPTKRSKDNT